MEQQGNIASLFFFGTLFSFSWTFNINPILSAQETVQIYYLRGLADQSLFAAAVCELSALCHQLVRFLEVKATISLC